MFNAIGKLRYLLIATFLIGIFSGCEGMKESTKKHSPQDTATYKAGALEIAVSYSKPYKKDRLIFGSKEDNALVPYGEVWRTGANEATQIKTSQDIRIGGELLPSGTYSIYTIPGPDKWIFAINSRIEYWGRTLFGSHFNEEDDVLRFEAQPSQLDEEVEQFTIDFNDIETLDDEPAVSYIRLTWDHTEVSIPFSY